MAWAHRSNRVYTITVNEEDVMTLMGQWRGQQYVALPVMTEARDEKGDKFDIPLDYCIERCWQDNMIRGFQLIISHQSFPECPEGMIPPHLYLSHVSVKCRPVNKSSDGIDYIEVEAPNGGK